MTKFTGDKWAKLARRLNEGGSPVLLDHGYAIHISSLMLEQSTLFETAIVFDLDGGGTGCVADVVITNRLDDPLKLSGACFEGLEGSMKFKLLLGPDTSGPREGNFCFPGNMLAYEADIVLNNIFSGKSKLRPREEASGLVLLVSEQPMPEPWRNSKKIKLKVSLFHGRSNVFESEFNLYVDPSARTKGFPSSNMSANTKLLALNQMK